VYCIHVAVCLLWNAEHSIVSTPPHEYSNEYSTQQHPSILTDYYNGL